MTDNKVPLYRRLASTRQIEAAWSELKKRDDSKGIDRVTIKDFEQNFKHEKKVIVSQLKQKRWKFNALKGVPLSKKTGKVFKGRQKPEDKIRGVRVAAVRDRVVQKAIAMVISPVLEKKYSLSKIPVSYAYVKSTDDDKKGAYAALVKAREHYKDGYRWAYKDDIVSFFDTVDRKKLFEDYLSPVVKDADLLKLIEGALAAEIANREELEAQGIDVNSIFPDSQEGIPQGSILSPMFSNLYLLDFDVAMMQAEGVHMVRYADDFLIMCKTKQDAINARLAAKEIIEEKLNLKLRDIDPVTLRSSDKKTSISLYRHVEFLGIEFDGKKWLPSGKAFKKAVTKLKDVPHSEKSFIEELNYLLSLSDSWGSTYWFTSFDKPKYEALNYELMLALERLLKRHNLAFTVDDKKVSSLGIKAFDHSLSVHNSRMTTKNKEE